MKIHRKYRFLEIMKAVITGITGVVCFYPMIAQNSISWTGFFASGLLALAIAGAATVSSRPAFPIWGIILHCAGLAGAFYVFHAWQSPPALSWLIILINCFLCLAVAGSSKNRNYHNSPDL